MPNNIIESSSFVDPDSLRKALQLSKNLYDCHTKKNCEHVDSSGSWYSGIIENHATELLIESRKLLMEKPSLKNFITSTTFDFYFDIQYSNLISTYDQQNTLVAVLKKNSLLPNKEYRIRFDNCYVRKILRSESWSDPTVKRDTFYETTGNPVLVVHDTDTNTDIEIDMNIHMKSEVKTVKYGFLLNPTTENFIDTYDSATGTVLTVKLTNSMFDLPFIWISCDAFRTLPEINFINNKDNNNNDLLSIGTDGHNISRLYPLVYGPTNVPGNDSANEDMSWYIKVIPTTDDVFYNSTNNTSNFVTSISEIHYIYSDSLSNRPIIDNVITFDDDFIKIALSEDANWCFKSPSIGNYDYDGTTYINPVYAYIELNKFDINSNENVALKSAFKIKFSDKYLTPYEMINCNATSGIHVDTSSEYSDNGIDKVNGMLHGLGEFNGLPPYFNELADRTVHRSHTELYSIRDDLNNKNQKYTDKQTAALLVDSAMPHKELNNILNDLKVIIKYKPGPIVPHPHDDGNAGIYYSDTDVVNESKYNQLSEITYIDGNNFGNSNIPRHKLLPKFIYHGNRSFSLNLIELDSELESARVYYLSNDDIGYENNEVTNYKKPPRTLGRICDIPTSFVNLVNIVGTSPTLIIDEDYIRSGADLKETEKLMMYNDKSNHIVHRSEMPGAFSNEKYIYDVNDNLDVALPLSYITSSYSGLKNLNQFVDLMTDSYSFEITNSGDNYSINDTFISILGGTSYRGTVDEIDSGHITKVSLDINESNRYVSYYNLTTTSTLPSKTIMKTTTTLGVGDGLCLSIVLSPETREKIKPTKGPILDNLITFKYDESGFVWIYKYDTVKESWTKYCQLTGEINDKNEYDMTSDRNNRNIAATITKNVISLNREISSDVFKNPLSKNNITITDNIKTTIPLTSAFDSIIDYSDQFGNVNSQDSYYVIYKDNTDPITVNYKLKKYEMFPANKSVYTTNKRVMPRFNSMNLYEYYAKSNIFSIESNNITTQPSVYFYAPFKSEIENLSMVSQGIYKYDTKHEITFMDIFYPDGFTKANSLTETSDEIQATAFINDGVINPATCELNTNVYSYNEYEMSDKMNEFIEHINSLTRDELIKLIDDSFGSYSDPMKYEGSDLAYTTQGLINYLLLNYYDSPMYLRNGIKVMRHAHEAVIESTPEGIYKGIGKQPTGSYVSVNDDIYDFSLNLNNHSVNAELQYVLRIDDFPEEEQIALDNYRIHDDLNNDISNQVLLIINNNAFILVNNKKWSPIK